MNAQFCLRAITGCLSVTLASWTSVSHASNGAVVPPETGAMESEPSGPAVATSPVPDTVAPAAAPAATDVLTAPSPTANFKPMVVPAGFTLPHDDAEKIATQVRDLQNETRDVVRQFREHGEELKIADWSRWNGTLGTALQRLDGLNLKLEGNAISVADWGRITTGLEQISATLAAVGTLVDANRGTLGTLKNAFVDDVDDVRENTADLVQAISESAANLKFPGWNDRKDVLPSTSAELKSFQEQIMQPGEIFDEARASRVAAVLKGLSVSLANLRLLLSIQG